MKKADQWSGFFFLILSALICCSAYDLSYGKVRKGVEISDFLC